MPLKNEILVNGELALGISGGTDLIHFSWRYYRIGLNSKQFTLFFRTFFKTYNEKQQRMFAIYANMEASIN